MEEGTFVNVVRRGGGPYACPCCGYLTLDERGMYEICPVCFWEDDGQDDHDAGRIRGGPNRNLSLMQARCNFAEFGASDRRRLARVRPPRDDEHPLA
ncbi:CPCC family cysteine-rich protein [Micromonospora palomenae]|nr:CPCC family cysteine-rich protein [Micromonospora palomenae]